MTNEPQQPVEKPRFEPEILPPEGAKGSEPAPQLDRAMWTQWETMRLHHMQFRQFRPLGPFRLILWVILAIAVRGAVLILFAGFLLVAIPVVAAIVAGSFLATRLRRVFRR